MVRARRSLCLGLWQPAFFVARQHEQPLFLFLRSLFSFDLDAFARLVSSVLLASAILLASVALADVAGIADRFRWDCVPCTMVVCYGRLRL